MTTATSDAAVPQGAPLALLLTGLTKTFGGQRALDDATLEVAQGEVHGLLGQNGSGKSTLIKILAGFHAPDPGGQLTICGVDVPLPLAPGAFRRHRISFVHQHLGLIPALTVLENMLIGRLAASRSIAIDWNRERRNVDQLFDVVRSVVRTGASVIFVSHDVDEVLEITDRATVLRDGRVVARLVTSQSSKQQFIEAIVGRRLSMTERIDPPAARAATQVE